MNKKNIPKPFLSAIKKIEDLKKYDHYLGAFVFGSLARGEQSAKSDLDVIVTVGKNSGCNEVNHPYINGIRLDISFRTIKQVTDQIERMVVKGEAIPFIGESIIIFDKTGELRKLRTKYKKLKKKKAGKKDLQFIQYMIYHADDKTKRNLEDDPVTALFAMNININDILKFYYHINGRWWISNKRLISDLKTWDPSLARLIKKFILENELKAKYKIWSRILDHVAKPIGGRMKIIDMNCNCKDCKVDLARLS